MAKAPQKQLPVAQVKELEPQALLDEMLVSVKSEQDRARDLLSNFVAEIVEPGRVVQKSITVTINARIAAIDELLSKQVDAIIHHEDFQRLEASWRGLNKLVMKTETGENLKLRVLNVSKRELLRDFQSAAEFTESALWKKVYEEEYGTFGGDPFGALIGDYEFGRGAQDVELLQKVSEVAAAAHAPFISAASPTMFGFDSFSQLPDPRDLAKIFDKANPENTKWLSFRDSDDARAIGLVLPHTLRRLPYGKRDNPVDGFGYEETVEDHGDYLWGNAAYDFAERLTSAFAKHSWCVAIRGPEGGGLVEDLPIHTFKTREGETSSKCPTEVTIPDTRDKELSDLGFIGLLNQKNTDKAAFFSASSARRPRKYDTAAATASDRLSCNIAYAMATSRIAHYLKCICRDKTGSFMSRADCETMLNRWIQNYVLDMDQASQEAKAERPLREARVDVVDDKARPGCYRAVAYLRPHFQLEEITVSMRLVADLPAPLGK
jgi:type VI secretion system protein ImpC